MSNDLVPLHDMQTMAGAIASCGLFGIKSKEQALALMLLSQAEGRHPALAARDYDIIQNKPAKKSEAMLRDFLQAGGKVEWHRLDDKCADATFSHPAGGTVRISWDEERAAKAGLTQKEMWKKFPRQMFRSRTVSEGVRTVCPMATSGMYVPEEVIEFAEPMKSPMAQWAETPPSQPVIEQKKTEEIGLKEWAKSFAKELKETEDEGQITYLMSYDRANVELLSLNEPSYYARIMQIIMDKKAEFNKPPKDINDDLPKDELTEALAIPPVLKRSK